MYLNIVEQTKYPKFKNFIKNELPKIARTPKISKALREYGEINKKSLNVVLTWGTSPTIKIINLGKDYCGEFTPNSKSNEIRINKSLVEKYEKGDNNLTINSLLTVTILHELSHWGDDQDGHDIPGEEGNMFEITVYGKVIPCVTN